MRLAKTDSAIHEKRIIETSEVMSDRVTSGARQFIILPHDEALERISWIDAARTRRDNHGALW